MKRRGAMMRRVRRGSVDAAAEAAAEAAEGALDILRGWAGE